MTSYLGKFVDAVEISSSQDKSEGVAKFYLRGLTVAEYIDLVRLDLLKLNPRFYIQVAIVGIEGWEGIQDERGRELVMGVDASPEDLPDDILIKAGEHIYHNLTALEEDISQKIRGFIRFLYWSSKDSNEGSASTFDCEVCLKRGLSLSRPCGRFSIEEREEALRDAREERGIASREVVEPVRKKYGNKRLANKRKAKREAYSRADSKDVAGPTGREFIMLGKFRYPECPISWIDDWVKTAAEVMYQAEKSNMNLFSGGLMDYPFKMYKASKVVKSEFSSIEYEEMEAERKKSK